MKLGEEVLIPEVDADLLVGTTQDEVDESICVCFCGRIYKCDVFFFAINERGSTGIFLGRANCPACGNDKGVHLMRPRMSSIC